MIDALSQLDPEFFDIFGLISFTYITFVAHRLMQKKKLPQPFIILLLLIGLGGLVIDALIVSSSYLIR